MPMYEYHCRDCGESFETLVSLSAAEEAQACPKCKSTDTERQFSAFATSKSTGGAKAPACGGGGGGFS